MLCLSGFTRGSKSIIRKPRIKTWVIGDTKLLQRYKLTKQKKWIIMLGLNPSQGINDLMDETNLELCNYIISSEIEGHRYKGYYLVNLSSVMKTNSEDLVASDFTLEHSKWLQSFLQLSLNHGIDLCLFYGRNVYKDPIHKEGLKSEVLAEIEKFYKKEKLYLTVDSNPVNTKSFNLFSHPSTRSIVIRKVVSSDLVYLGF